MKCDIVIPVWNQLELTKKCVDSIVKNTADIDYRIIIIDNASDSQTVSYLASLDSALGGNALVIRNNNNLGFVKAANQGIRLSEAEYVCVLNNDVITTDGWLSEMIAVAESSPGIGLVNPSSNTMGQKPGKDISLEDYALSLKKTPQPWEEIGSAIGFCMLIKRSVIEKVGVFDEIYGIGNFEDTDYSRRAVKSGFLCVRACRSYVYHVEGRSFGRDKRFDENFERNRQIYEFRWGRRRWIAYILSPVEEYALVKFKKDALNTARKGFWVWAFFREKLDLPRHSNIIAARFDRYFYTKTLFKILFKKKKFSEIYASDENMARILKWLSFIHKARVYHY